MQKKCVFLLVAYLLRNKHNTAVDLIMQLGIIDEYLSLLQLVCVLSKSSVIHNFGINPCCESFVTGQQTMTACNT